MIDLRNNETYAFTTDDYSPFGYPSPPTSDRPRPSVDTFASEWHYYIDGYHLVSIDGTVWNLTPEDSKHYAKFTTAFPYLSTLDDGVEVRRWYDELGSHCNRYHVYLPPFYLHRSDCNSLQGFTCGDDIDDDLPPLFSHQVRGWTVAIAEGLKKMNQKLFAGKIHILDGYKAIRAIIIPHHPSFMAYPEELIIERPRQQRSEDLATYYIRYFDWLTLNGFINNVTLDVESPSEQKQFVMRTHYKHYLLTMMEQDRRVASLSVKFSNSQFVNTLNNYIDTKPSHVKPIFPPSVSTPYSRYSKNTTPGKTWDSPYRKTSINEVTTELPSDVDSDSDSPPQTDLANICNIYKIVTKEVFETQFAARVRKDPTIINTTCMLCQAFQLKDKEHRFGDCPILRNHPLLSSAFIDLVQFVTRLEKKVTDHAKQDPIDSRLKKVFAIMDEPAADFQHENNTD